MSDVVAYNPRVKYPNYDPNHWCPCHACGTPLSSDPEANICSNCYEAHLEILAHSLNPTYDPTAPHESASECIKALSGLYFDWSIQFVKQEGSKKYRAFYSTSPRPVRDEEWRELL